MHSLFNRARILNPLRLVKGGTQYRSMGDLATQAATYTAIVHVSDRIRSKWIWVRFDSKGWAAGKPDTGVIPRADLVVYAEPGRFKTNTALQFPGVVCFETTLAREHTLPIRDDYL